MIRVARTAEKLAHLIGFSVNECKMMLIAGYLHDLGKMLNNMVTSNALDENVVAVLINNFQEINDLREQAQQEATERYNNFLLCK